MATSQTQDNPSAFACAAFALSGDTYLQEGMTLRDWFAGQVASGMAAHSGTAGGGYGPGDIAVRAYEVADALISARPVSA